MNQFVFSKHLHVNFNFMTLYGVVKGEFKIEDWSIDDDICVKVLYSKCPKGFDTKFFGYVELPYIKNLSDWQLAFYGRVYLQNFINVHFNISK